MTSLVWLGLGNLALAAPLAMIAWLSGRLTRRPANTHGLWVLVLLKLVTPPIGWVPVGRLDEVEHKEPAVPPSAAAVELSEWEQIAVAPAIVAPPIPIKDEMAAELDTLEGLGTLEGASPPIEQVAKSAIEEPNIADALDLAPVAANAIPGNGDAVAGPAAGLLADIRS